MRTITSALLCLILSSTVCAASKNIRVINASANHDLLIKYQVCSMSMPSYSTSCTTPAVELSLAKNGYTDVTIPEDEPTKSDLNLLVIHEMTSFEDKKQQAYTHFDLPEHNQPMCFTSDSHDVIILNDYNTDKVVCETKGRI